MNNIEHAQEIKIDKIEDLRDTGKGIIINGKRMISPSSINSMLFPMPNIPEHILEPAIRRGNEVSEKIQEYFYTGKKPTSQHYQAWLDNFFKWLEDGEYTILDVEKLVYKMIDEEYFGGFIDLLVKNKMGVTEIIEIKTQNEHIKCRSSHILQASMYKMVEPVKHHIYKQTKILYLTQNTYWERKIRVLEHRAIDYLLPRIAKIKKIQKNIERSAEEYGHTKEDK